MCHVGSHSPSPTAQPQRPSHLGGARQRPSIGAAAQSIPRSPNLAATNPLLLARLSSSAPAPSVLQAGIGPLGGGGGSSSSASGESSTWQRREPRNRSFPLVRLSKKYMDQLPPSRLVRNNKLYFF